jgi:signal transduction histidine kinase
VIETELGPLAFSFVTDASARRQAEAALRESERHLRALAGRLISADEDSRKQLARDLHDVLSQRLALLSMEVSALEQESRRSAPGLRERLVSLSEGVVRLASDVQRISRQLHPSILADLGLAAALESECSAITRLHGTPAKMVKASVPPSLSEEIAVALYRIAQEALRNAAKHSQATEILVSLDLSDGDLVLNVQDNGRGFDATRPRKAGLGLVSIQERARLVNGSVKLQSAPRRGTSLEVRVPLPKGINEAPASSR